MSEVTYALARPADAEDDRVMGEHDQDDVAAPSRPPVTAEQARDMTAAGAIVKICGWDCGLVSGAG
ncbi:hypothetical protein ACH4CE_37370 [Streptomyces gelaticus]|uniref:hypothetical protein n=1 Tax=Streptomyces gelaticus TaxID=285446 RepID=UPI0037BA3DFC